MCWKKQTIWTSCWHTTSESGVCAKQERQTQQNLDSHDPGRQRHSQQPAERPLWMSLLCFPCILFSSYSSSSSSPASRKRCRTETATEEAARLCPRCQTIRDAPCLVPGTAAAAVAAANSNTRFDVTEEDIASAAKRRGFVGDGSIHPVGRRDSGAGQSPSSRDRRTSSSSRSGRQRAPQEQSRPRRDAAAAAPPSPAPPSPRDSTEHLRPAPLRISKAKRSQVPTQPEASTNSKNVSSSTKSKSSTKKKRGRSAVELMANQPMSTLVEDVEKTWEDGSASAEGQAPYAPYAPDLSLDELFEEVELMWQRGVEPLPPAAAAAATEAEGAAGRAWL